jgi:uncharacterized membrane protein
MRLYSEHLSHEAGLFGDANPLELARFRVTRVSIQPGELLVEGIGAGELVAALANGEPDAEERAPGSRKPVVVSAGRAAEVVSEYEHRRAELRGAFGNDAFGRLAERAARFFGTPQYIVGQTVAVLAWVVLNSTQLHLGFAWDVYPFIALNLLFSLQAAYAAPLILLAQTRQADRDKMHSERVEKSHSRLERAAKAETDKLLELLQSNTDLTREDKQLTEQVADLTRQIHALLTKEQKS